MSVDYVDLFGWDTVFGISYTKANQAIRDLKSTPPKFDYDDEKGGVQKGTLTGQWGDWQLTTKGDGQNLTLQCPIVQGTFTTIMESGTTFAIDNTWIEIEVKLQYLDQDTPTYSDPTATPGTGTQKNLQIRTASSEPADPVVSIEAYSFTFPTADDPEVAAAICSAYFKEWFNQNLSQFNHVFSVLVVNQLADKDQFQWLKPTDIGYAVSSTDSLDTSVFGVLAMTESRSKAQNAHQIDSRLLTIAGGTHSAFAIAAPLFVKKWLMPGLLAMRLGSSEADYVLSNDGLTWANKHDIQWSTFTDKHNNPVPAYIPNGKLTLGVVGDTIKADFQDLYWEVDRGITMHVQYTEYYSLSLKSGTDKYGKPYQNVLTVTENGTPYLTVGTDVKTWKQWTELGVEMGLAVLGAIAGGLAGGFADAATDSIADAAANAAAKAGEDGEEMITMDLTNPLTEALLPGNSSVDTIADETAVESNQELTDAANMQTEGQSSESILAKYVNKVQDIGKSMWKAKWRLTGAIVGGVIGTGLGFIPKIIDLIEQEEFSSLPSLDEFGQNCVGAVQWPDGSTFNLTAATLLGALILSGDLQAQTAPTKSVTTAALTPNLLAAPPIS